MLDSAAEKTYALFANPTNKKIVSELEKSGAKVFKFPPLETEKIFSGKKSIAEIENLDSFDWIIFPDVLTVNYFLEILTENEIDLFALDSVRVCAFGETVADHLRFAQLHADVVPISLDAAKVFSALIDYIGKEELKNRNFLLPKEISLEYEIEKKLSESGAKVVGLPVYQAKISEADEIARLKILLKGGAIDEFIFSTPTDLLALKFYFKGEPISEQISEACSEIGVFATDKVMFQFLKENDFPAKFFRLK